MLNVSARRCFCSQELFHAIRVHGCGSVLLYIEKKFQHMHWPCLMLIGFTPFCFNAPPIYTTSLHSLIFSLMPFGWLFRISLTVDF